jgi:hypothetical protein
MDRNRKQFGNKDQVQMEPTAIDHILATEEELVPSSGFLASVMERVRDEAVTPASIPFPWKRAIPGILLAVGVLGWGAFELVRAALPALHEISLSVPHISVALTRSLEDAGWVALALGISLVCSLLSRRLAGRSGLL